MNINKSRLQSFLAFIVSVVLIFPLSSQAFLGYQLPSKQAILPKVLGDSTRIIYDQSWSTANIPAIPQTGGPAIPNNQLYYNYAATESAQVINPPPDYVSDPFSLLMGNYTLSDGTGGLVINTRSPNSGNLTAVVLNPSYNFSPLAQMWPDSSYNSIKLSVDARVPIMVILPGPASNTSYGFGYLYYLLHDSGSNKDFWYGSHVFDGRPDLDTGEGVDPDNWQGGTGAPIVNSSLAANSHLYASPAQESSSYVAGQAFADWRTFAFTISREQFANAIRDINQKIPGAYFSQDLSNYSIRGFNFDTETSGAQYNSGSGGVVMSVQFKNLRVSQSGSFDSAAVPTPTPIPANPVSNPFLNPSVWIDGPLANATVSGTVGIGGWAINSTARIGSAIGSAQLYVDNLLVGPAAYGNLRNDVCAAFPGRALCPNVGFNVNWDSTAVANGQHTLQIVAANTDASPVYGTASITVNVNNAAVALPTPTPFAFVTPTPVPLYLYNPGSFPTGSLVLDNGTVYYIYLNQKIPFTSSSVFNDLGYSWLNVVTGDSSAYTFNPNYILNSSSQAHPIGQFVSDQGTVYYISLSGLIGIPTAQAFLSNGGLWQNIVKANNADKAVLNANPYLPLLTNYDSRVVQ